MTSRPDLHPTLRRLDDLAESLDADRAVIAVLGLGSAGLDHDRFDDHSDIDFFLIVEDGEAKRRYVDDTGWLGGFGGDLVYAFANDPNGRKALFADGLFLEYAVFTREELRAIPVHRARVVWSRAGFELTLAPLPAPGWGTTVEFHLNEALTNLFVGLHRELRGERLAAMRFIQVYAVDRVICLARLHPGPAGSDARADPFEASRRAEGLDASAALPLDRMVPGYAHNVDAAAEVLEWLTSRYRPGTAIVAAVRALIERARQDGSPRG